MRQSVPSGRSSAPRSGAIAVRDVVERGCGHRGPAGLVGPGPSPAAHRSGEFASHTPCGGSSERARRQAFQAEPQLVRPRVDLPEPSRESGSVSQTPPPPATICRKGIVKSGPCRPQERGLDRGDVGARVGIQAGHGQRPGARDDPVAHDPDAALSQPPKIRGACCRHRTSRRPASPAGRSWRPSCRRCSSSQTEPSPTATAPGVLPVLIAASIRPGLRIDGDQRVCRGPL